MVNKVGNSHWEIMGIFKEHRNDIFKSLFPDYPEEGEEGNLRVEDLADIGSPASIFYKVTELKDGKDYEVFVRHYSKVPEGYRAYNGVTPWQKANLAYDFLAEAGVESVSKTFLLPNSSTLFLRGIKGNTLEKTLEGMSKKEVMAALTDLLKVIGSFQYRASEKLKGLEDEEKRRKLFSDRSLDEKIKEYFEQITKNKTEENVAVAYTNLIGRAFEGNDVYHGDLSPTNIIIGDDGKVYFIDPELKTGNEFNDLGSLLAYPGINLNRGDWEKLARRFKRTKLEVILREEEGITEIVRIDRRDISRFAEKFGRGLFKFEPYINLTEKGKREALFNTFASILHYSVRIIAKNQVSGRYESCDRQERNIEEILHEFISKPDKFGLSKEDIANARIIKGKYGEMLSVLAKAIEAEAETPIDSETTHLKEDSGSEQNDEIRVAS